MNNSLFTVPRYIPKVDENLELLKKKQREVKEEKKNKERKEEDKRDKKKEREKKKVVDDVEEKEEVGIIEDKKKKKDKEKVKKKKKKEKEKKEKKEKKHNRNIHSDISDNDDKNNNLLQTENKKSNCNILTKDENSDESSYSERNEKDVKIEETKTYNYQTPFKESADNILLQEIQVDEETWFKKLVNKGEDEEKIKKNNENSEINNADEISSDEDITIDVDAIFKRVYPFFTNKDDPYNILLKEKIVDVINRM